MNEATAERRTGLRCLRFFVGESVKTAKSQTFLNSPRRLGLPRQRAVRRGSQAHTNTRNTFNSPPGAQRCRCALSRREVLADAAENQRNSQSQTFLNSLRRLEPPRQRAARRSSRITQKHIQHPSLPHANRGGLSRRKNKVYPISQLASGSGGLSYTKNQKKKLTVSGNPSAHSKPLP